MNMDIRLLRSTQKTGLVIRIKLDGISHDLDFWRTDISEVEMVLLQEKLSEIFNTNMREIRRVYYEKGWRDRGAKRRKNDCFPTWCSLLEWEKKP